MIERHAALALPCPHWQREECRSCGWLEIAYPRQLERKVSSCRELVGHDAELAWLAPCASPTAGFRNKAKMAVAGAPGRPLLGLADAAGHAVDLRDCPLYPADMQQALGHVGDFIAGLGIAPYDIAARRGELKFILLTRAPDGAFMLRFVLRSRTSLAHLAQQLPRLRRALPALAVASVNLQPTHVAAFEGAEEILLEGPARLEVHCNGVPLYLRPQCFWQTNDRVAAALYRQVRDWCCAIDPHEVWDLYCGVGGFALHCADGKRRVTGIESSAQAIQCARDSARTLDDPNLAFVADDAVRFAAAAVRWPALLIVNPPRRGLGDTLAQAIETGGAEWLVYSSCNPQTLARDLERMPSWQPLEARVFDMFPHTHHVELALLLQRRPR